MVVEEYNKQDLINIYEATMKKARINSWPSVRSRVSRHHAKFLGVTKQGVIQYKVNADTTDGFNGKGYWLQEIYLTDLPDIIDIVKTDKSYKVVELLDVAITTGNFLAYCNDPSYKYYFQYWATQEKEALYPEKRFPRIRNPKKKGTCCKHLLAVFKQMPNDIEEIVKQLTLKKIVVPARLIKAPKKRLFGIRKWARKAERKINDLLNS